MKYIESRRSSSASRKTRPGDKPESSRKSCIIRPAPAMLDLLGPWIRFLRGRRASVPIVGRLGILKQIRSMDPSFLPCRWIVVCFIGPHFIPAENHFMPLDLPLHCPGVAHSTSLSPLSLFPAPQIRMPRDTCCASTNTNLPSQRLCPLLNGTMKTDNGVAEHGGFGNYNAPTMGAGSPGA